MKTGIELIAAERQEQLEKHGRTVYDDVIQNNNEQLREAALKMIAKQELEDCDPPNGWDAKHWFYMANKRYEDRLIIAGALIAAELDRIQSPYHPPTR